MRHLQRRALRVGCGNRAGGDRSRVSSSVRGDGGTVALNGFISDFFIYQKSSLDFSRRQVPDVCLVRIHI